MQVLKAVRGGVQDVAAKLIRVACQSDMDKFVEVRPTAGAYWRPPNRSVRPQIITAAGPLPIHSHQPHQTWHIHKQEYVDITHRTAGIPAQHWSLALACCARRAAGCVAGGGYPEGPEL